MEQEIKLNIAEGVSEVVIREGQALVLDPPVKVSVTGLITAPAEYFTKRKPQIDSSHIICDRNKRNITLITEEKNCKGTVISGHLKYNKELADFNINKNTMYGLKELTQLLRIKRMHFESKEEHRKTIEALNKFYAKIMIELKDSDDHKGNIEKSIKKQTESNSPLSFKLDIPIYEGQPKNKIFVDVLADVSDAQVKFWLESVDLIELEFDLRDKIIDAQLNKFGKDLVVLEV